MPGWVSKEQSSFRDGEVTEASLNAEDGGNALDQEQLILRESSTAPVPSKSRNRSPLTQSQRDELLAEVLGDVIQLNDQITQLTTQIKTLGQAVSSNDFVRWRNALDLKMTELADINLSQKASARLQAFASTYLQHLSQETNKLVRIEVKRAVSDTLAFNRLFDKLNKEWLLRLGTVAAVSFGSTLAALFVWGFFR